VKLKLQINIAVEIYDDNKHVLTVIWCVQCEFTEIVLEPQKRMNAIGMRLYVPKSLYAIYFY